MSQTYLTQHEITPAYAQAMQLYEANRRAEALPLLLAEPVTSPCYAVAQGNAAMILLQAGQAAQAGVCAYAAIQHFDQQGCTFTPSLVQFSRHLAEALAAQGHDAQAAEWFEIAANVADGCLSEAQSESERSQLHNEKAHTLVSWGNSLLHLQHYRSAIDRYEEAREIYRQHPSFDSAGVPQALTNLAIAASQIGDLTRADYALHEALTVAQQQHDDDQVQRIRVLAVQSERCIRGVLCRLVA